MPVVHLVDAVIAFTVLEALVLLAYHRRTGRGVPASQFLVNMVSGLCLMLGLRFALAGASWPLIGACLLAAGLAHATDLVRRWPR